MQDKRKRNRHSDHNPINEEITFKEVRVIADEGENMGVLKKDKALSIARERGLDLVLISEKAVPPIVKITDFGKHLYDNKKKLKEVKQKEKVSETKIIQIKPGTGKNELGIKGKKISKWLEERHRVRIDLFLWGRYKYMEMGFLKSRLHQFLEYIEHPYTVSEDIAKSGKGLSVTIQTKNK